MTPGTPNEPIPAAGTEGDIALETLSALGGVAEAAEPATHMEELLCAATRHCQKLVGAAQARIWLVRRGGRWLVAREFGPEPTERRLRRGEGLAGWAIQNGEPLRVATEGPRPELRGPAATFRNAIVVPLFRRGIAFGAIECLDKPDVDFSDSDLDHLVTASEHIALALDNALLFQETERRALEREVLLEVSRTLSSRLDFDELLETFFRALRQVVQYDAAAVYLVNRTTLALELVGEMGYPEGSERAFQLQVGQGIVGWVAKTGEPVIVPDVHADPRYVVARADTRSELAAPLVVEGRPIGVFNLESDRIDAYHDGHLEIVKAFAAQAAVAVERARLTRELLERRRIEKELAIAREIQLSFLPVRAPEIPGFEIAGTSLPHDQVGGDYYDFIPVSETRLGLAIADVSGKGIPAALIMAGFRMSLLAEIRNEFAIRAVMRKVNTLVHESTDRDKFVTAFYGVLDFKNRALIFSNGGHNPPILLRRDGTLEYLLEGGVALGVLADARYEERPIALRAGDVLVLYTDGVSEAEAPSHEQFGPRRIEQCVARDMDRSAQQILDDIVAEVKRWSGDEGLNDDLTLVVVKVLETPQS
jgi:serine phosphatase RsbU (regulator of sigma subunit)